MLLKLRCSIIVVQAVLSGDILGGSASFDISDLSSGLYTVKLMNEPETHIRKIAKK